MESQFESAMHIAWDQQCLSEIRFFWHFFTCSFSLKRKAVQSALNQQQGFALLVAVYNSKAVQLYFDCENECINDPLCMSINFWWQSKKIDFNNKTRQSSSVYFVTKPHSTTKSNWTTKSEWHHQFLNETTDVRAFANAINDYFISFTDNFVPIVYSGPQLAHEDLFVSTAEVARPDNVPNRLLKEFAPELARVIQYLFNPSLVEGTLPALLKSSIVTPMHKVSPPSLIEKDLRPISLTCQSTWGIHLKKAAVGNRWKDRPEKICPWRSFNNGCTTLHPTTNIWSYG